MDLYSAAYHGNVKTIKKLLDRVKDQGGVRQMLSWRHPHGGATALYVACEFGHLEAAKALLEAGAPPDQARDDGATPLYKACQDANRLDIARLLLKSGAVADQVDQAGMTPLWVACHQGKTELATLLLDNNADPSRKVQGWSPLDLARKDKREDLVKLILGQRLPPLSAPPLPNVIPFPLYALPSRLCAIYPFHLAALVNCSPLCTLGRPPPAGGGRGGDASSTCRALALGRSRG